MPSTHHAAAALATLGLAAVADLDVAEARCAPVGGDLQGLYAMKGVREVGSQILLGPDGSFQYMLAYGAVDELARGCWSRREDVLTLRPTVMRASRGGHPFRSLDLRIDPKGNFLRTFDSSHVGSYVRS